MDGERGSVVPLMMAVMAVAVLLAVGLGSLARGAVLKAEAQSAADAAALAGVVEGRAGATDLAARNGATIVSFEAHGERVLVVVEFEGVRAEAAAILAP